MVDLARPHDHGPHDPRGPGPPRGVLTGRPGSAEAGDLDPDRLLEELSRAGAEPLLAPLRIPDPPPSARRGVVGSAITRARRAVIGLLSPVLADLIGQLERDRHRLRGEIDRLERRVAALERDRADDGSA